MAGSVRAALIPPGAAKPSPRDRFLSWVRGEVAGQGLRWRLWAPVAFGGGCGIYFSLKVEPPLWPLVIGAVVAVGIWLAARARGLPRAATLPLMLLMCVALGLAAAKVRAERVAGPIAPVLSEPTTIEGWVLDVDGPGQNGHRVVIAPVRIRGVAPEDTPIRVRATVKGDRRRGRRCGCSPS